MAQFGKASSKRGKPSYFMSVLGVTLVLFLLGILGWLGINSKKVMQHIKESVQVEAYLKDNITESERHSFEDSIVAIPGVINLKYTDKETARKEWVKLGNEFSEFLDNRLLPSSYSFNLREAYVDSAQLVHLKNKLQTHKGVDEIIYSKAAVGSMERNFRIVSLVLLAILILVAILVIILIDNTIRLAMFSNRFLIKTMQMVGATRGFIARPLAVRAMVNGAISAVISTVVLYGAIKVVEGFFPEYRDLFDVNLFLLLFLGLLVIGVSITLLSTYRSVLKYLRMKLDELY
jgi:cell division transport system permease protein